MWGGGLYRADAVRAKRKSSKAAVHVEGPYETDSLLSESEGYDNPYDERPVSAPLTDPAGERLLGRAFRPACFLGDGRSCPSGFGMANRRFFHHFPKFSSAKRSGHGARKYLAKST
jgi:hypothetical protein